jgi:hypothetical protein
MRRALAPALALALTVAAAACGKPDNAPGPGGVTVGEARALDEAAAMIEDQPAPRIGTATVAPAAPATGAGSGETATGAPRALR